MKELLQTDPDCHCKVIIVTKYGYMEITLKLSSNNYYGRIHLHLGQRKLSSQKQYQIPILVCFFNENYSQGVHPSDNYWRRKHQANGTRMTKSFIMTMQGHVSTSCRIFGQKTIWQCSSSIVSKLALHEFFLFLKSKIKLKEWRFYMIIGDSSGTAGSAEHACQKFWRYITEVGLVSELLKGVPWMWWWIRHTYDLIVFCVIFWEF